MRVLAFVAGMSLATLSLANTSGFFAGASLTNGTSTNKFSLSSTLFNPAVGSLIINDNERIRTGYVSSLGFSNELGDVEDFEDELNDLIDTLDDDITSLDQATQLLSRFNSVLPTLGEAGYLTLRGGASFPVFPVALDIPQLSGQVVFDLGTELVIRGSVLDDALELNPISNSLQTNTALYLKSGTLVRAGVTYSRAVWSHDHARWGGQLFWGSRLNIYSMALSKQVIGLETLEGDEVGDVIQDDYDNNEVTATQFGFDQGLLWVADRYQVGFTLKNINEPEFEYGAVGQDCASITSLDSQTNCFVAQFHANALGNLALQETHTMHAFSTLDATYQIMPRWLVSFAYDLGEYEDFVGDDMQFTTFATSYYPNSKWVPGVRMGYRVNQVGSELSTVNLGLTLFGIASLDLEYGLESTEIDGSEMPRKMGINLGFEERF